jgi:hypothetical protein
VEIALLLGIATDLAKKTIDLSIRKYAVIHVRSQAI